MRARDAFRTTLLAISSGSSGDAQALFRIVFDHLLDMGLLRKHPDNYTKAFLDFEWVSRRQMLRTMREWAKNHSCNASLLRSLEEKEEEFERQCERVIAWREENLKSKDISLATFSSHPNMEIRLFNPLAGRGKGGIAFLSEFSRVNHRMHNKLFVMDNAVAVIGGRNIGDRYFGVHPKANARDLDMLVVGPAVQELSETFDLFWNSRWAYPVVTLTKDIPASGELEGFKTQLTELVSASLPSLPYSVDIDAPAMYKRMEESKSDLTWVPIEVLYDTPDKVQSSEARISNATIVLADEMKEELLMEMAYFVPGKRGVFNMKEYVERGVKVKILTNSMASNNVTTAHAGYAKYRKSLLEAGVELHEYRPDAADRKDWAPVAEEADTQLHSKTFVIDRKIVFVGTYNLDPRSKVLNTEMGLLIRDPGFAGQVADFIEGGMGPANSYRVILDENDPEKLLWITMDGQKEKKYRYDPKAGFWKYLMTPFIQLFPIEGQL
ncbi:phospholipase D-like domain-containing protein, partial [bacterium]|nr:phospholipase D-like domain-containing protein [bacterium]